MTEVTWNRARKNTGAIKDVVSLIQAGYAYTRGRRGMQYKIEMDKQRRASTRGEGKIEDQLLSIPNEPKECLIMLGSKKLNSVNFRFNAFGIGATKQGNVIADLFGLDKKGSPVCGEVKITSGNPWSAVVQSAEQVALLRSDRKFFLENLQGKIRRPIRGTGSWGLVIAPPKYWNKKEAKEAKRLVEHLRKKTKVRICCVSYDSIMRNRQIIFNVICGLPPYAR